ncbi:MAG: response regulator [candidate division Zixibacteria bacterium]|nr:response regulator [candidate division Zixibacteria bacterium]MBU1471835.1 response regulator [candidate division Zixibacteria bacterium]MBU2625715.1 response regulator [candidate division Zixibacteria bacterium]
MSSRGLDICIIDDEIVVCKRLQQYLSKIGYSVETFVDSQTAIGRINEKRFDIVVTDIRMDNIDGMQVLNHIMEKGESTKVILITGYATIEIAREAQAKGAFDFISKPFRPQDLKEVIDRAAQLAG